MSRKDSSLGLDDEDDVISARGISPPEPPVLPLPARRPSIASVSLKAWHTVTLHLTRHAGAGIMASVAYFDPGNWSVDLQAGSNYGYKLLFVILLAGLGAIVLQVLACRLGCVTGLDLASHCRILLHDHPRHPRLVRRLLLYPLYVLSEIAIISTDLAELLGSAIALNMIFPKLPLWAGVILTSLDVLVILALNDGGKGRPVRIFEAIIIVLVLAVMICFIILIVKVDPRWPDVFKGYLPSKTLVNPSALYTSIGILGATVMPHALFLGSSLATLDRISSAPPSLPRPPTSHTSKLKSFTGYIRSLFYIRRLNEDEGGPDRRTRHEFRQNNSYAFVSSHLTHGMVDIIMSLLGFAVPINSAILILAGTVFFITGAGSNLDPSAGLFNVHDLIGIKLGKAAAFMFAFALLSAGQSASITATLAGQIVSEGFLEWKISPFTRRLITRLMGLIPSTLVAALVGRNGIDTLLVASQVALSIVLPFVVFPLVYLTSSHVVMRVKVPSEATPTTGAIGAIKATPTPDKEINYRNGKLMMVLGYLIFSLVVVANAYVLVTLMLGQR